MSDPDKSDRLISKADALLGRYRPTAVEPASAPATEAGLDFPVLTEIVDLPDAPASPPVPGGDGANAAYEIPVSLPADLTDIDAARLREEILATLTPELEQRLSDTIKPRANELLDWAMQTVQLELGLSIRAAVRSAVAEAVNASLERLQRERGADKAPP